MKVNPGIDRVKVRVRVRKITYVCDIFNFWVKVRVRVKVRVGII